MDKNEILQELVKFADYELFEGANYLQEQYFKLGEREQIELLVWLRHERDNFSYIPEKEKPIQKRDCDIITSSVRNRIRLFLEYENCTTEDILDWIQEVDRIVKPIALQYIKAFDCKLVDALYPSKEDKIYRINKEQRELRDQLEKNIEYFNPYDIDSNVTKIQSYRGTNFHKLPKPKEVDLSSCCLFSECIKKIIQPSIEKKQIIELLEENIKNLENPNRIPKPILVDIFQSFGDYFQYKSEEDFIRDIYNQAGLKTEDGKKIYVTYLFQEVMNKFKIEKTELLLKLFGMRNKDRDELKNKAFLSKIDLFLKKQWE